MRFSTVANELLDTYQIYKKHFKNYFLPFYLYWVYHGRNHNFTSFYVLLLSLINLHHIEFFVQPRFWENQPPPRRLPFFVGIKQHRLTKAFKTCATKTNVYLRSCKGSNLPPLESFLGSYSICEFCD